MNRVDVLVVTHKEPDYALRCLDSLLNASDDDVGVWIWHNGDDEATLSISRSFASHRRVVAFHHSPENLKLREATNWMWRNGTAELVGKLDDDCLVGEDWAPRLLAAHEAAPHAGALAGWHFQPEDFDRALCLSKIEPLGNGDELLRHAWVQGSGYIMKRRLIARHGVLASGESWTRYCLRTASRGWAHGWLLPLLLVDHLDDPRSPNTAIKTDRAFLRRSPLSSTNGATLASWDAHLRRDAVTVQTGSTDPRHYLSPKGRIKDRVVDLSAAIDRRRGGRTA